MRSVPLRWVALPLLCAAVFLSQHGYDAYRAKLSLSAAPPSAGLVRAFDLGLHSAMASLLWIDVRNELPFLVQGSDHFLAGLKLVNDLDPRWSTPYAFSVLVLPNANSYKDRVAAALEVGKRGLAQADQDWKIPFYMGTAYQLELGDHTNAAKYFDLAANTPGIPDIIRRFAVNYGIRPDSLASTKASWTIIRDTSQDELVRQRAEAHIAHLEILEYLNAAVGTFHAKMGQYPSTLEEVVSAGILTEIPQDPFGFKFKIYDPGVVGIAP